MENAFQHIGNSNVHGTLYKDGIEEEYNRYTREYPKQTEIIV